MSTSWQETFLLFFREFYLDSCRTVRVEIYTVLCKHFCVVALIIVRKKFAHLNDRKKATQHVVQKTFFYILADHFFVAIS
jgi:hypothetical protein